MTHKNITIKAQSASLSQREETEITVDHQEFGFDQYSRGFNVAVLNEVTGQRLCCTTFDTYVEGSSDAFVEFVNHLPEGRIVAIAIKDDASFSLSESVKSACKGLGSIKIYGLQFRSSWAMIGQKGAKPRTAKEELSNYCAVTCFQSVVVSSEAPEGPAIGVTSGGGDHQDQTQITIKGEPVTLANGYQRGLNVVVFDPTQGTPQTSQAFDLFADPSQGDAFAEFIEKLPPGQIVAIAVKDDASLNCSDRVKAACASIGSRLIHHLTFRSSWAIVGYKGAPVGSVVEHLSHEQTAFVKFWIS